MERRELAREEESKRRRSSHVQKSSHKGSKVNVEKWRRHYAHVEEEDDHGNAEEGPHKRLERGEQLAAGKRLVESPFG